MINVMGIVPDYLTRYYKKGENPFLSLNDLPLAEANRVKALHCAADGIGGFYASDDYLPNRREIEKWIYGQLLAKGGQPTCAVPVYMTLGDSPTGKFDIRADLQKNAAVLRIPVSALDMTAVTFTFPDSMYQIVLDDKGELIAGGRTNRPTVYLIDEMETVMTKYASYLHAHYVEAQVWNRNMLYKYMDINQEVFV